MESIYYFEAEGNYTKIFYFDEIKGKIATELVLTKIGKIEEELAEKNFVRIHKSYLINLSQISNLSDKAYFYEIDQTLTIGRKYKTIARDTYLRFVAMKARGCL